VDRDILFVIGDLDTGGAERHLVKLLPALSRHHFRPFVYTLTHKGTLSPQLERAGVEVFQPPLATVTRRLPSLVRRLTFLPLTIPSLAWLMVRRRPDIVHFFLPAAYLIGGICARIARIKVRVMSRRSLNVYQRAHPFLARLERWLHQWLTAALGNSRVVVAQLIQEGIPANRLGLIYNGIDMSEFSGLPERSVTRTSLGLEQEALIFVIVASLIPYKGHRDLLAALHRVRDQLPQPWRLLCVGKDIGIGAELRAYTESLGLQGNVSWLGERFDVPAILQASDIGIMCSHQEGFSNSVIECMAAGLPMIVTDVGGNSEAVLDGVTGLLVPVQDEAALAAAVLTLGNDPRRCRSMGKAGKEGAGRFSFHGCLVRYLRLYSAIGIDDRYSVSDILDGQTQ
jgi:glycosyltransferase involved in cell wall biosynthesis